MRRLILGAAALLLTVAASPNPPAPIFSLDNSTALPTGANTAQTLAALAAQQGVLLDAFKLAADPDYTLAMGRAVAAQVPILLGPKTYTVNNFSTGAVANFVLRGVKGSVIQRTSASGSNFFTIGATNVVIDGVTFDMNKGSVSANQWGVLLNAGGQTVSIRNSVFKNNSGTTGSCLALVSTGPAAGGTFSLNNNEITGCTFNPIYLGSVSNGDVNGNYIHDNSTSGLFIQASGVASSTNYSTNILVRGNVFRKNTGAGIAMGSFSPPYTYANPGAIWISVVGNVFQDNSGYQVSLVNTDHVSIVGNQITQSASGVSTSGGIDCNSQHTLIEANDLSFPSATFGIDCGAAVEPTIRGNNINMGAEGAAVDVGGVQNGQVINNHIDVAGTGVGVLIYDMETDGSLNPFPYHASNITVQNNDITLSGASTIGIQTYDDAGATSGALPIQIIGNRFVGISGAASSQDVKYFSAGTGIIVQGNTHNGSRGVPVTLNGNTDYVFDTVYDYVQGDLTAGSVRSFVNDYVNQYNAGTKILWVLPTAGGSGYTAETTLAANGGCTWAGTPLISAGVIIGVRTTSTGASCSNTTTITATDAGGGAGATFSVAVTPNLPGGKAIQYRSSAAAGNVVQTGGGFIGISGAPAPMIVPNGYYLNLVANGGGSGWILASSVPVATYTVSALPTCSAEYKNTTALVIDASSPTYNGSLTGGGTSVVGASCNGTSWNSQ